MGLEEIKTANVDNSFKKFSIKRKERNGAGAGSRIQSEFFGFWVFLMGEVRIFTRRQGNG